MLPYSHIPRTLIAALICLCPVIAGETKTRLAPQSRFEVTGNWVGGSIPGHVAGRGTLYSNSPDATATWFPAIHSVCPVRLSFWVSPHAGNTPAARIEYGRPNGKPESREINLRQEPARWEPLGVLQFDGSASEFIRLSRSKPGNLRASALKLDVLDPQDPDMVWQTLILDELVAYDRAILAYSPVVFDDIPANDPLATVVARLVAENILLPAAPKTFAPEAPILTDDFLAALCRVLGETVVASNANNAVRKHAQTRGWIRKTSSGRLGLRDAFAILVKCAQTSGRPLDWLAHPTEPGDIAAWSEALDLYLGNADPVLQSSSQYLTRAQAARLLSRFQSALMHSGPPGEGWKLTFQDDFNATEINRSVWSVSNKQTWGKLLSIRMTGNVVQENGLLRLITRKENVGGKEWTTGMIGTANNFRQAYGYWEARMRYASAPGLNNAFWTNPGRDPHGKPGWEIDINEGHWPNTINASLHQEGLPSQSKAWRAPMDLSSDFHTYGCLWTEKEVVYYWDGREIDRKPNTHAQRPGPVIFSTAVFPWAGSISDALHETSMDVDWVRVWNRDASPSPAH
jgi:beta-glucanase (GH16 family)